MNDYKMKHAKKHKDTQVDYITVIDHSTVKKEIKTLLEIKVDDKVTLAGVFNEYDKTINGLLDAVYKLEQNNIAFKEEATKHIEELYNQNKQLQDEIKSLQEQLEQKIIIMKGEVLL